MPVNVVKSQFSNMFLELERDGESLILLLSCNLPSHTCMVWGSRHEMVLYSCPSHWANWLSHWSELLTWQVQISLRLVDLSSDVQEVFPGSILLRRYPHGYVSCSELACIGIGARVYESARQKRKSRSISIHYCAGCIISYWSLLNL